MSHVHAGLFVLLMAFWVALSDQYTPLFLGMGVASAAGVTLVTQPLVASVLGRRSHPLTRLPLRLWRVAVYVAWVLRSIVVGGIQVAWVIINPRVLPEPRMLRFRTRLRSSFARVIVANTISVVPGTMTVRLQGDEFWVHALRPDAAADLLDGTLQGKIAAMFFEEGEQAIDPVWEAPPEVRR